MNSTAGFLRGAKINASNAASFDKDMGENASDGEQAANAVCCGMKIVMLFEKDGGVYYEVCRL